MTNRRISQYQEIAYEYYDINLHPTCANFREASEVFLSRWIRELPYKGRIAEVGSGMSLLHNLFKKLNIQLCSEIILIDSSPTMLDYSKPYISEGVILFIGHAEDLPFATQSIQGIVSSLGDPYNSQAFWKEAGRVLVPGGKVMFTTPSYEWALKYRSSDPQERIDSALFTLRDGRSVHVPSFILDPKHQISMISRSGFSVERWEEVTASEILYTPLSSKLCLEEGTNISVVTGYLARKI